MDDLHYIRGLPFPPESMGFLKEKIEAAMDYIPEDGDIVVSSYPKTGSTWIQYILWSILKKGAPLPSFNDASSTVMPFMERVGIEAVKNLKQPRTYKNHFPYHLNNINKKAKYVYIHRNPKDNVISYYYFLQQFYETEFDFKEFFQAYIDGKLIYGDFFDHVLSWYEHRNDPNILFLSYEKMTLDPKAGILEIAEFLGPDYYESLKTDEDLLQKVLDMTSFNYMKKNLQFSRPSNKEKGKEIPVIFFRKGIVGDGKSALSEKQNTVLLKKLTEKMEGIDLKEFWLSYF